MDSNALLPSRRRVRKWQESFMDHAESTVDVLKDHPLRSLYIRSFAWIGSVEPCTGVLCETCQRCLRDFAILKVRKRTHHATVASMLGAVKIGCRICTCLWRQLAADRSIDPENVPKEMNEQTPSFSRFWSLSSASPCSRLPIFKVGYLVRG